MLLSDDNLYYSKRNVYIGQDKLPYREVYHSLQIVEETQISVLDT